MVQKKHIIILVLTFFSLCVFYYFFIVFPKIGRVAVEILVNPEDANISINGTKSSDGVIYLRPDTYVFKAEKPGWISDEVTVRISENNTTVALLPTPDSNEAKEYVNDQSVALEREGLSSTAANTRGVDIRSAHPILNELPYSDLAGPFKIDYGFNQDDKKTPYLIVSFSTPHGRSNALKWLRDNDVDPATTEIIFEDFVNPIHKEEPTHD